ncbi:hypothetical protein ACP70R_025111 [Stipagrostis hirtigluma subsp. patula]
MAGTASVISFALFIALVCQVPAVCSCIISPSRKQGTPLSFISCKKVESPTVYQSTLGRLHVVFTRNSTKDLCAHPFLPDQTPADEAPFQWIPVRLFGWDGGAATTLLFRNDNMNLVGFANKTATWFSFKGFHHLIPGSIPLDFGVDYQDLVGGWEQLHTVPLGQKSLELATRNLSGFDLSSSRMDHARISVAQLIIMYPEALRFFPIREKVINGWEGETFLTEGEKRLVGSWENFSLALIDWSKTKQWKEDQIHPEVVAEYDIKDEQDALKVVDLLVNPREEGF